MKCRTRFGMSVQTPHWVDHVDHEICSALEVSAEEGRLLGDGGARAVEGAVVRGLVLAVAVAQDPSVDSGILRRSQRKR